MPIEKEKDQMIIDTLEEEEEIRLTVLIESRRTREREKKRRTRSLSTCEIVLSTLTIETEMRRISYSAVTLVLIHFLLSSIDRRLKDTLRLCQYIQILFHFSFSFSLVFFNHSLREESV